MEPGKLINIHAVIPCSRVNGPGRRMVVFFQGCRRACPGCFNPGTHSFEPRRLLRAEDIFKLFFDPSIEGMTVSGGEPFEQARGLKSLLEAAVARGLTTVVYTGFRIEELAGDPGRRAALGLIDVLVDGPYEADKAEPTLLARGSTNQRFHFLTGRYVASEFIMPGRIEVVIGSDGDITETGFGRLTVR